MDFFSCLFKFLTRTVTLVIISVLVLVLCLIFAPEAVLNAFDILKGMIGL